MNRDKMYYDKTLNTLNTRPKKTMCQFIEKTRERTAYGKSYNLYQQLSSLFLTQSQNINR